LGKNHFGGYGSTEVMRNGKYIYGGEMRMSSNRSYEKIRKYALLERKWE